MQQRLYSETGKSRAARIPLDYLRERNWVARRKTWLIVVALFLGAGVVAALVDYKAIVERIAGKVDEERQADWWVSGAARQATLHGPLTRRHAAWESQCDRCHIAFSAISDSHWTHSIDRGPERPATSRCSGCHNSPMHLTQKESAPFNVAEPGCAACHHEHRGRDASLVDLPNLVCTTCHQDLTASLKPFGLAPREVDARKLAVRDFDESHPAFPKIEDLPRRSELKFDHRRHITLDWDAKAAPGRKAENLSCDKCHRLAPIQTAAVAGGARPTGEHFLPVTYKVHCGKCHQLTVPLQAFPPQGGVAAVPHGLQPAELRPWLDGRLVAAFRSARPAPPPPLASRVQMPGLAGAEERYAAPSLALWEALAATAAALEAPLVQARRIQERILYEGKQTCGECHSFRRQGEKTLDDGAIARMVRSDQATGLQVARPEVPQVWWTKAKFGHLAHSAVSCRECHELTGGPRDANGFEPMLLPAKENCTHCHGPKATFTGVRSECTLCHTYHGADAKVNGPAFHALEKGMKVDELMPLKKR